MFNSSAKHYDHFELELLKAWKPLDNSQSMLVSRGKWPNIIFLMETKIDLVQVEVIKRRLGFTGRLAVNPVGRKGVWPCFGVQEFN